MLTKASYVNTWPVHQWIVSFPPFQHEVNGSYDISLLLLIQLSSVVQPSTFKKYQAIEIGNDFRKVTRLVTVNYNDLLARLKPHQVIVKTLHLGINASDVNYTNGKYVPGIKP